MHLRHHTVRTVATPLKLICWGERLVEISIQPNDIISHFRADDSLETVHSYDALRFRLECRSYDGVIVLNSGITDDDVSQFRASFPDMTLVICCEAEGMDEAFRLLDAGADDCVLAGPHYAERIARQTRFAVRRQSAYSDMQQLRMALAAEKMLNERQQDFIALVSHEFRTPLAIIGSATQLLEMSLQNDLALAHAPRITKIQHAVHRLSQLIDSVTLYYKMEEGVWPVRVRPFSIHAMLMRLIAHYREVLGQARLMLDCTIIDPFFGDEKLCESILENVVSNALKYSPADTLVIIAAFPSPNGCRIRVSDQGAGMSCDAMAHLGERFYRASASPLVPGSGLGLHLAMKFAKAHQGHIYVCSAECHGTSVDITLASLSEDKS